jgi:serine/threonine protein kinase
MRNFSVSLVCLARHCRDDSDVTKAADGSAAFFREVDALVLPAHPCVVRTVGYCLATPLFPAQIGTEFATGGSLRDALPRLDDTGKATIVVGIVLGMKFIHSRGAIHRDLKPANILLDDRGHPQSGDLGSSRFCDLKLALTSGVGTPLCLAPEMYEDADCTAAVDVYSFSLIVFVGNQFSRRRRRCRSYSGMCGRVSGRRCPDRWI